MYKVLKYNTLSALVDDYAQSYLECRHQLVKMYIGLPFSHDIHSNKKHDWRVLNLRMDRKNKKDFNAHIDRFAKDCKSLQEFYQRLGEFPENFPTQYPLHVPSKLYSKRVVPQRPRLSPIEIVGTRAQPQVLDLLRITPESIAFQKSDPRIVNVFVQNLESRIVSVKFCLPDPLSLVLSDETVSSFSIQPNGAHSFALRLDTTKLTSDQQHIELPVEATVESKKPESMASQTQRLSIEVSD